MQHNTRMKQAFSILIIAFMILSTFAIVSDHVNSGQNSRPNIIKNSVINHERQINVPESIHSALFGFNSSSYGSSFISISFKGKYKIYISLLMNYWNFPLRGL